MRRTAKMSAIALLCVSIVSLFTALWNIHSDSREYSVAREQYRTLREIALPDIRHENVQEQNSEVEQEQGIDFDALLAINSDVISWIEVYGSDISYPIVQTNENSKYLNYTFTDERNRSGSIFLDHRDASDFLALARVYGHNMRDGSMLGTLSDWQGDTIIVHTFDAQLEFAVIERSIILESQVQRLADEFDGLALITCVSGRRSFRYVVLAETVK